MATKSSKSIKETSCPDFRRNMYSSCTVDEFSKNETQICYCDLDFQHLLTWRGITIFTFLDGGIYICRQQIRLKGLVNHELYHFRNFQYEVFPNVVELIIYNLPLDPICHSKFTKKVYYDKNVKMVDMSTLDEIRKVSITELVWMSGG